MIDVRPRLQLGVGLVWAAAWMAWLATGALLPLPPWSASRLLANEERLAARLAAAPAQLSDWSLDVGGSRQAGVLGAGWSVSEAFVEGGRRRSFVWIEGRRAALHFASSAWAGAQLAVEASPLEALAPLAVDIVVDDALRGTLSFARGWSVQRLLLGSLAAGPHALELRPRAEATPPGEARALSLAVDGVSVGTTPDLAPTQDRGVFAGRLRVGLEERPALFVSAGAEAPPLPPGSVRAEAGPALTAWYGFGRGGAAGAATPALVVLHGWLAAALVVLVPGLVWSARFGRSSGALRLAETLGLSTLVWLAGFVLLRLAGVPPQGWPLAATAALLGGAPLASGRVRLERLAIPWSAVAATLASAVVLSAFATEVVPPLEDQDMEVQATAWALATRQTPLALTNRGTAHFFAHPPLLHVWQAGSFALGGRLERVRYHADAGAAALASPFRAPEPGTPLANRPHHEAWKLLLRRFLTEPQLWATRQVNVLLAALAVGLVVRLCAGLAGSTAIGLALGGVLLSFPEFLVRGAYGGYFAATTLLTLVLLAGLEQRGRAGGLVSAGALAFLANQKGLLVPVAWAAAAPLNAGWRRLAPLAGALLALGAYVAYGLALDAPEFVYDFLQEHVLRRLNPHHVRFASDASLWHPSIPALWLEFGDHYGWFFLLLAALASGRGLASERPAVRAAAAAVVIGAVAFSVTDWRQTKHLSLLVAPALVALAGQSPEPRSTRLLALACLLFIARNVWRAWPLWRSFEALRPSTIW